MQFNLLIKKLEKISLELNSIINLLLYEKQISNTFTLKYSEDLEHILHRKSYIAIGISIEEIVKLQRVKHWIYY